METEILVINDPQQTYDGLTFVSVSGEQQYALWDLQCSRVITVPH